MIEQYGDLPNEGQRVEIRSGPRTGVQGIVKVAGKGKLVIQLANGDTIELDEDEVQLET